MLFCWQRHRPSTGTEGYTAACRATPKHGLDPFQQQHAEQQLGHSATFAVDVLFAASGGYFENGMFFDMICLRYIYPNLILFFRLLNWSRSDQIELATL